MLLSGPLPSSDAIIMNSNILARNALSSSLNFATLSTAAPFPTVTIDLTDHSDHKSPQLHSQSNYFGLHVSQGMDLPLLAPNADAVSSATAAITANPNITAALAAAIASVIDNVRSNHSSKSHTATRNSSDNNA